MEFMLMDMERWAWATKRCDGCRYCVQTDKTERRPLASVAIEGEALCTYFPGYCYCWSRIDDELVDDMIAMLAFMDNEAVEGVNHARSL